MEVKLQLIRTIYHPKKIVPIEKPQVVLCGRSNVGKSSLINCLANKKKLAKTSSTPGKTRSINFYEAVNYNMFLVDLPGYGYAACSKREREKWPLLIKSYFDKNLPHIKGVVLILDSRLPPQSSDVQLLSFLENSFGKKICVLPVLTKIDRCKTSQLQKVKLLWGKTWSFDFSFVLFSARTGVGTKELWKNILKMVKEESASS